WAFAVIMLSIVVDFWRARALYRTAEKTSSHALEADALHFNSDMWSSLAVLVGLFGITLGFASADSVAAVAVSILICIAGGRLGRRPIDTLTDPAPRGAADKISAAIKQVPGVVAIERLRMRQVSEVAFVDPVVAVSRTLPIDRVAAVKERIVEAVRADSPAAEVTVTTEPLALDDETVLERGMVIARSHSLARLAPRDRACDRRAACGLARSGGRRRPLDRRSARYRNRARRGDPRGARTGGRGRDSHRAAAAVRRARPRRVASTHRSGARGADRDRDQDRFCRRDPRRARARGRRRRDRQFSLPRR